MYYEVADYNALKEALQQLCNTLSGVNVPQEIVLDSKLVADELLSNVLQHGGGKAFLTFELKGDLLVLSVGSEKKFRPPEKSVLAGVEEERGRGLYLVDALVETRKYSEEQGISVMIRIKR